MFDTKDPRSFDLQQVAHNIKTINYCLCDSFSGTTLVSWPMLASVWPNWPIHISAISVQFRIPDFMETSRHKACLAMPHYNSECHHLLRPLYRVDSLDSDGSLLNQSCILAYNIQPTIIYLPGFTVGAGRQQTRIRGRIRKTRRQLARGPETTSQVRAVSCLTCQPVTCGIFGRCTQRFLLNLIQTWPSSPHPCFVQAATTTIEAATESLGAGSYHDYEDIDWYFPTLPDIQQSNNECSIFRIVSL